MRWTLLAVVLGFLLDLCFGDPRWLYHPVRIIGKGITFLEKILRNIFPKTKTGERIAGGFLVVGIVAASSFVPWLILHLAYGFRTWLGVALESFMCYQLLAAAVETVAENTSDGIIAPLFYMMIGGAVLGFAYKSVNTMDSMVGYVNDKYQYFGTAAAKLDDVLNYIPARLSAWLMIAGAWLIGMDGKNAKKIYLRDRRKHASPNSAQTEAVMAGALDIQLAGDAWYFGELHKKPFIGDPIRKVEIEDILRSHKLMYAGTVLSLVVFGLVRVLVCLFI